MATACLTLQGVVAQTIVVESDGSVRGRLLRENGLEQPVVFRFGLPAVTAERRWQEKSVLRGSWVRNGVRYVQTVLVSEGMPMVNRSVAAGPGRTEVLLVNIEGQNTNGEYAEAFAELVVEIGGKRQPVELKQGLVWCGGGESRWLVGALEIPESGIKAASGDALRFYGNIPPSLNGAMTLKIPLEPLVETASADWLIDLEFDAALRRAVGPRDDSSASTNVVRVVFGEQRQAENGGR